MPQYKISYAGNPDCTKRVTADNPERAAYLFFCNSPKKTTIIVKKGLTGEDVYSPDNLATRFPDVIDILQSMNKGELEIPKSQKSEMHPDSFVEDAEAETRYGALRFVSGFYCLLAILSVIAGAGMFVIGFSQFDTYRGNVLYGSTMIINGFLFGIVGCVTSLAITEGIKLFIDLEYNSRTTTKLLTQILHKINTLEKHNGTNRDDAHR